MRVVTEYFFSPLLEQTVIHYDLEKVFWMDPLLGISKDQLSNALKAIDLEKESLVLFLSPIDPNLVQGIIFVKKGIGFFDLEFKPFVTAQKAIHYQRALKPGYTVKSVDSMQQAFQRGLKKAQEKITEARAHSSELRAFFDGHSTQAPITKIKNQLLEKLDNHPKDPGKPEKKYCLLDTYYGAFTSRGPRYFTYPLSNHIKKWIIIKGHAEKDISTMMSEIKKWAEDQGLSAKVDRCPMHTSEIDRLLLPDLQTGLIDGNTYHPFEPVYPQDVVIDLDDHLPFQEIFYYFAPEIRELKARYKQKMRQATLYLQEAANDLWAFIQLYEPILVEDFLLFPEKY